MDRTEPSRPQYPPSMRTAGTEPRHVLSPAGPRERGEPGVDAADRRAVLADAVLWLASDGGSARHPTVADQSQAHAAADAVDGSGSDLSQAAHHAARCHAQDLPVFAAELGDYAAQSGLVVRHHVRADADGLHVPDGRDRLVQPLRAGLGFIEYVGRRFLRRGVGIGLHEGASGDFQHGPGSAIHESGVYQPNPRGLRSAWTVAAGPWTTCSSNGCGGA